MSYLIELRSPGCPVAYVLAQADTCEDARALVDAELGSDDAYGDVIIVAVHTVH